MPNTLYIVTTFLKNKQHKLDQHGTTYKPQTSSECPCKCPRLRYCHLTGMGVGHSNGFVFSADITAGCPCPGYPGTKQFLWNWSPAAALAPLCVRSNQGCVSCYTIATGGTPGSAWGLTLCVSDGSLLQPCFPEITLLPYIATSLHIPTPLPASPLPVNLAAPHVIRLC